MEGNFILFVLVFMPFAAGLGSYLIGRMTKPGRDAFVIFAVAAEFAITFALWGVSAGQSDFHFYGFAGLGLHFRGDGFRLIMAAIAGFVWFFTTLQTREYFNKLSSKNRNRYYMFMLWTLGATMGIFLSANLYTTFIFFEIMSFTSYVLVIHNETPEAQDAAKSYVGFAVFGGLVTLMGLFMLDSKLGSLEMDGLLTAIQANQPNDTFLMWACILTLIGFGVKAGMFPLHTWLPKSYVAAPEPATALLSAVLSKAGIFGIFVITGQILLHNFAWGMIILTIGVFTMTTGAMLAVFSTNFKRTLACSSMSQIGFILVATGMQGVLGEENALAVSGSILHVVNHSIIKLVLFMVAGVIFVKMRTFDLNDIRGFGRKKPILMITSAIAILGVAGVPFLNGYISKTLIHESIVEYIHLFPEFAGLPVLFKVIEWIFVITGGLTLCYMLKIFVAVFIEKNDDPKKQAEMDGMKKYMSKTVATLLIIAAAIMPFIGIFPHASADLLADYGREFLNGEAPAHVIHYFSGVNLKGAAESLAIGVLVYFFVVRIFLMKRNEEGRKVYINAWSEKVDIEKKFYRPALLQVLPFIGAFIARFVSSLTEWFVTVYRKLFFVKRPDKFTPPVNNEFGVFKEPRKPDKVPQGVSYTLIMFIAGLTIVLYFVLISVASGW